MSDPSPTLTGGPLLLADLSSPETAALLPSIDLVLIPVGAHEQHGPNIAVSTDTVSAESLCQAAAALAGPHVAVAPAIPWGISWHHMRFPGTITLRPGNPDRHPGGHRLLVACARCATLPVREWARRQLGDAGHGQ